MDEKLSALLEYVRSDGRVCPMPDCWHQLWEMLPDKKRPRLRLGAILATNSGILVGYSCFVKNVETSRAY